MLSSCFDTSNRDINNDYVADVDVNYSVTSCSELSFVSLNVCGLRSRLQCKEFVNYVQQFDVAVFLETKTDDQDSSFISDCFSSWGYDIKLFNRKCLSNRRSGGIGIAIRSKFSKHVESLPYSGGCVAWHLLKKSLTGYDKDCLIGGVYVPPEGSVYSNVELFDVIETELSSLKDKHKDCYVLLLGDFNAYTKCMNDYIDMNQFSHSVFSDVLYDMSEDNFQPRQRVSQDKQRPNNYGYRLLDLCKSMSVYIFNGRLGSDAHIGMCTCNGSTVVDYIIGSQYLMGNASQFKVDPFDALLSDVHCPLCLSLTLKSCSVFNEPSASTLSLGQRCDSLKVKRWDNNKSEQFAERLANYNVDEIIRLFDSGNISVSEMNKQLSSILVESAKDTLGTYSKIHNHNGCLIKKNQSWFNGECKVSRRQYFKAKHKVKISNTVANRNNFAEKSKEYKKVLRRCERKATRKWHKEIRALKSRHPRDYWEKIKNRKASPCPIPLGDLKNHFQLLNQDITCDDAIFDNNVFDRDINLDILNDPITKEEVEEVIKCLKNNKAGGVDLVINEYIKNSIPYMTNFYCSLFNRILDSGIIPEDWVTGLIVPLYKGKGDKQDCNNYRGGPRNL